MNKNPNWVGKYHYVMWSGGLDSTYLLDRVAYFYSTPHDPVYTISFKYPYVHKLKEKMEEKARNKYLKYAKKKGYNIQPFDLEITEAPPSYTDSGHCEQAKLWFFLGIPFVWSNSVVHFGYVKRDSFWHDKQYYDAVMGQLPNLGNDITVAYDLENTSKHDIIDKIPEELYWYCESPEKKKKKKKIVECGRCNCCIDHKLAEYQRELISKNRDIKELL